MIKLLKFIKAIYLKLNLGLAKFFFNSNTYLFKILKTLYYNRILKLQDGLIPISGNIKVSEKEIEKIKSNFNSDGNLNEPNPFYSVQTLDYIPNFYLDILKKNRVDIENYVGKQFKCEKIILTCRKKIPKALANEELYNNTWHQDSDTYKQLRIFFLTDITSQEDGPFTYLSLTDTKKYWRKFKDRDRENSILDVKEQLTFTGSCGDYFIVDPSRVFHRAGNPKFERYMFSMTLYPYWEDNNTGVERFIYQY
jgi:hypothetical protein